LDDDGSFREFTLVSQRRCLFGHGRPQILLRQQGVGINGKKT
jgi:hypothetical protein